MVIQNEFQCLFSDAVKVCKEESYYALRDQIKQSFQELIIVEAQCRRDKVSSIIRALQSIEKEQFLLENEYKKVLSITKMSSIPALEDFINGVRDYRKSLMQEKKRIERTRGLKDLDVSSSSSKSMLTIGSDGIDNENL